MARALRLRPPDFVTAVSLVQAHGVRVLGATNTRQQGLLHIAARDDAVEYAALALARGGSPTVRDVAGAQPLRACAEGGLPSLKVASLLCGEPEVRRRINDRASDGACVCLLFFQFFTFPQAAVASGWNR